MMNSWETPLTTSPMDLSAGRGHDNFFHVVPPTPRALPHGLPAHAHTMSMDMFAPGQPHSEGLYGLRPQLHRSRSSVGSIDSTLSYGGWSTQGTEFSSDQSAYSMPPHSQHQHQQQQQQQPGLHAPPPPQATSVMAVDPRLFAPKPKTTPDSSPALAPAQQSRVGSPCATPVDADAEGEEEVEVGSVEDDDEELRTAKPQTKSPKSPRKKKTAEDKKKVSHARKQSPAHIPRPRNAFILFRKHVVDSKLIPASVEMRHQNVSIITAKMWAEAPAEQKAHFNELAKIEKEEHMKKYPGYRYQPVYRRTNVIRRRVRKDEAEEEKCKSVAELLMKGKVGKELEAEIRDKARSASVVAPVEGDARTETENASSRRGSACELSKGALRALRAQARQRTASVDWTETSGSLSRQGSPGLAYDPANLGHSRHNSVYGGLEEDDLTFQLHNGLPPAQQFYAPPAEGFGWFAPDQGGLQQSYAYPEGTQPHGSFDSSAQMPMGQTYSYPQPSLPPFSMPDAPLPLANGVRSMKFPSIPDISFSSAPAFDLLSPTEPSLGGATGSKNGLRPPSARWDRTHFPQTDVPFDALFDNGDLLLQDFGTALAQADEGAW